MREFAQLQELQVAQSLHVLIELLYIKSGPRSNETLRIECDVFYNPAVALCFFISVLNFVLSQNPYFAVPVHVAGFVFLVSEASASRVVLVAPVPEQRISHQIKILIKHTRHHHSNISY